MSRLPIPGQDSGTWGDILNDYLLQAHSSDGTLKPSSVTASHLAPGSVKSTAIQDGSITTAKLANTAITITKLDSSIQTSLSKADSAVQPGGLDGATASLIADTNSATYTGLSSTFARAPGYGMVDLSGLDIVGYWLWDPSAGGWDYYWNPSATLFSLTPHAGENLTSITTVDGQGWLTIDCTPDAWGAGQSAVYAVPALEGLVAADAANLSFIFEMKDWNAADISAGTWGEVNAIWRQANGEYVMSYQSEVGVMADGVNVWTDFSYAAGGTLEPTAEFVGLLFSLDRPVGSSAK